MLYIRVVRHERGSDMTTKKIQFLDWLKTGVQHGVITEKKAKDIYETKYAKLTMMDFLDILYEV